MLVVPGITDRLPDWNWTEIGIQLGLVILHVAVLAGIIRISSDEGAKKTVTFRTTALVYLLIVAGMTLVYYLAGPHLNQFTPLAMAAVPAVLLMFFFRLGVKQIIVVMLAFIAYLVLLGLLLRNLRGGEGG